MCLQRRSGTACFYNRVHHRSKFRPDFPSPAITWNISAAKAARGCEEHWLWELKEEICACAELGQAQVLCASGRLFTALRTGLHIFPIFFSLFFNDIFHLTTCLLNTVYTIPVINLLFGLPFLQCFLSTCLSAFALIPSVICYYAPQLFLSHTPLLSSALRKAISFIPLSPEAISVLSLQNLKHLKNDKIKRSAEKREREKGGKW